MNIFYEILQSFKRRVIAGIVIIVPISITIYILNVIWNYVIGLFTRPNEKTAILKPILAYFNITEPKWITISYSFIETIPKWIITSFSFLITIILLYLIGYFSTKIFAKKIINYGEKYLLKIPLVKSIYSALKQVMVFINPEEELKFKNVVLIDYPIKGIKALGYVTGNAKTKDSDKKYYIVFVPTTPNPTTGFLIFAYEEDLEFVDVSVEEGLKFIASVGVIVPKKMGYIKDMNL